MHQGKLIVLSAPSGSGKTTLVKDLLKREELNLGFSISAASREPRVGEIHGKDYYFLSLREFKDKINVSADQRFDYMLNLIKAMQ